MPFSRLLLLHSSSLTESVHLLWTIANFHLSILAADMLACTMVSALPDAAVPPDWQSPLPAH
ncbi:uncharacterized protein MYCFIDRAFT_183105 [Pseudocercospora fijiensis CIRAD86]|uniref:Uncharacterized protein n=1 Tax=Pseudocercospora fijiensis (strain CIRAD86) TaxID=383855 RepID=M3AZ33_PSEFD|nr:uncharacterized protein MYCFIDRAFT_183105 [Pseudocercospora fijiensis CIRAD86]EME82448.1 hypothetical protein MYCFIDRAFT_183105 [Pseudocercospora fijiensis CIRAD86]